MAIDSNSVWECRTTATAANANGGFYVPGSSGTDYSQRDNAQYNLTGGTIAGAGATVLHASASADMVGNGCKIASGTNIVTGSLVWRQILSVSVGVSITFDANVTTGASANIAMNIGGALSLGDSSDATALKAMVAGNKAFVKAGTYSFGSGSTANVSAVSGTTSQYIVLEGYNSSRGDRPTGSNRPLFNCATVILGNEWSTLNIQWAGTVSGDMFQTGTRGYFADCSYINKATAANEAAVLAANYCSFHRCEFSSYNGYGVRHSNAITISDCYFHDSQQGIRNQNGANNYSSTYVNNLFIGMYDSGIFFSTTNDTQTLAYGNTFIGGVSTKIGSGIKGSSGTYGGRFYNNIFYGLATGVNLADSSQANVGSSYLNDWNDFYNNTSDTSNFTKGPNAKAIDPSFASIGQFAGTTASSSSTTLTDSGATFSGIVAGRDFLYVSASTGGNTGIFGITGSTGTTISTDNSLGSGSSITYSIIYGRNAAIGTGLKGLGSIGIFEGSATTGYLDIGAVQRQESGSGVSRGRVVNV